MYSCTDKAFKGSVHSPILIGQISYFLNRSMRSVRYGERTIVPQERHPVPFQSDNFSIDVFPKIMLGLLKGVERCN